MPPLSLYIHVPWCLRKCPYCDFNSHEVRDGIPEQAYLEALFADLDHALTDIGGRGLVSIFIGGGTPSLLSPAVIGELLAGVSRRLSSPPARQPAGAGRQAVAVPSTAVNGAKPHNFAGDIEITLEANPGAIEAEKFAAFRAAGVTRLSLGIQSFDDGALAALGRIHTGDEARRAAELALRHFGRVNLDLIYGLPGQTPEAARRDVGEAVALGAGHISAYQLTIEPNTAFFHAPPALPDEDASAAIEDAVHETLAAAGYEQYEVSAFARPAERSRHNLNYWTFGDYLGIGAGAHSKITRPAAGTARVFREARPRHPRDYLADPVTRRWQAVASEDLPGEFMMNALRLTEGFEATLFETHTGLPLAAIEPVLARATGEGLLAREAGRIAPTPLGRRFLNRLIGMFLSA